jgi:hypothetical protein
MPDTVIIGCRSSPPHAAAASSLVSLGLHDTAISPINVSLPPRGTQVDVSSGKAAPNASLLHTQSSTPRLIEA